MPISAGNVTIDRRRAGWWLVGLALAVVVGLIVRTFVGTVVFGLFVYYAVRPIHRRLLGYADSRLGASVTTMIVAAVPLLVVMIYAAGLAARELVSVAGPELADVVIQRAVGDSEAVVELIEDPTAALAQLDTLGQVGANLSAVVAAVGFLGSGLLRLSLALALAFFLLQDGGKIDEWFREEIADGESVAYVYLRGVDADIETVYFGNVLTVVGVTVASVVVYNVYNALAPAAVSLPVPTLLALLTGLATFVPIVVGKLVYLPAGALLFVDAVRADASFLYPIAFLAVAFVLLDVVPQTFVRPYVSGRSLHPGLVLFGYVMGAAYFGWYGLFLGPLVVVVTVQFLKQVLPDLVRGDEFVPDDEEGVEMGTDPLTAGGPSVPAGSQDPDRTEAGEPTGADDESTGQSSPAASEDAADGSEPTG